MFFFNPKKTNSQQSAPSPKEPHFSSSPSIVSPSVVNSGDWSEKSPTTFLNYIIENNLDVKILFLDASAMKTPKSSSLLTKAIDEFLVDFSRRVGGRIFELAMGEESGIVNVLRIAVPALIVFVAEFFARNKDFWSASGEASRKTAVLFYVAAFVLIFLCKAGEQQELIYGQF